MKIVTDIKQWQQIRKQLEGKTVGFIPTMGHLHQGHLSLCKQSKQENEMTVVSIFVNPTQFNQAQDFEKYPRTYDTDKILLQEQQVDYLFMPNAQDMYPDDYQVRVDEIELSQVLEGKSRPGHFMGMLTVVLKLLNLVQASRAYFGEKDYQQLLLVKKMVSALFLPVEIVGCRTVRAEDNLALSSRNSRLSITQRNQAALFPQILEQAQTPTVAIDQLEQAGFKVDYVADQWGRRLAAVWLDEIRLIDNVVLEVN
jgi:pantoate--beta-alanine ligase